MLNTRVMLYMLKNSFSNSN